jgi:hypothetical protein
MSQLTTLITGAGITTPVTGQAQCEQTIVIGTVDTANPLQGLAIDVDGTTIINIQNAALLTAYAKWMKRFVNNIVGIAFSIASGRIPRSTNYRFTNAGVTTPAIFAFSDNSSGIPILAATKQVQASSYEDFQKFSALFISVPANLLNCEVVFKDGTKSTMTPAEVAAEFILTNDAEASGFLGACLVIDNRNQNIRTVRVNASGTAVTVLIAKLPDISFQMLNK